MNKLKQFLKQKMTSGPSCNQSGGMLTELLLSLALASITLPFIFQYQQRIALQSQNVAVLREMENIQGALEKYIVKNREDLLSTVGKNITRLELEDLSDFGVFASLLTSGTEKYQLRVLKSNDDMGHATLQGVIVMSSSDITPLRTREIVNSSGGIIGFVDGARAYGAGSAWRSDAVDMGIDVNSGIVGLTSVNRDNASYLWRIPSDSEDDATMRSSLNLGNHDIQGAAFFDAGGALFNEGLTLSRTVATDTIFQNRTTIDSAFVVGGATISGILSADSKNMEVSGKFKLADVAKFSDFVTQDLWVNNLNLNGLYVSATSSAAPVLKINNTLDISSGRIDAIYATVGYAGSITPKLYISGMIADTQQPAYYWDSSSGSANFSDATLVELNRLATYAVYDISGDSTASSGIFTSVATNKNATVADFMNAISEIQKQVSAKYRLLNLE